MSNAYLLKDASSKKDVWKWLTEGVVKYASRSNLKWSDEDTLCEYFFGCFDGLVSTSAGKIDFSYAKIRGRGKGAKEKTSGADGLGILHISTDSTKLNGYFLFQAKKAKTERTRLTDASSACDRMLELTAASHLVVLLPDRAVWVGAMAGCAYQGADPMLTNIPYVGFPNFVMNQILSGLMVAPIEKPSFSYLLDKIDPVHIFGIDIINGNQRPVLREILMKEDMAELDALLSPTREVPQETQDEGSKDVEDHKECERVP